MWKLLAHPTIYYTIFLTVLAAYAILVCVGTGYINPLHAARYIICAFMGAVILTAIMRLLHVYAYNRQAKELS